MMKVSDYITKLVPYVPGKPIEETQRQYGIKEVFKLASNENPLGPSPLAIEAIKKNLHLLNLYPDASCYHLKQKLAQSSHFDPSWIAFANGSDEFIDLLVKVYCEPGDKILTSHRAFASYQLSAQASRCDTTFVPQSDDLKFDVQKFKDHWTPEHKLIFITNPNNPTGTYCSRSEMNEFYKFFGNRDDVMVVVDEAYYEFVRAKDFPNSLEDVKKYSNVVCLRTMSKVYGLAGLRLGMMFTPPSTIELMNKVRKPFNVNSLVQVAAIAALDDKEFLRKTQELTWKSLDYFYQELSKMKLKYFESQGNFVLFDTQMDSLKIYEALLKKGIILRPVKNYDLPTHLRMSVGLEHQNKKAIESLKDILS